MPIKNKEGKLVTADIMSIWKEYFQELLRGNNNQNAEKENKQQETIHISEEEKEANERKNKKGIQKLKLVKAAGHDGITPEMLKHMGKKEKELPSRVIKLAWKNKRIPKG